MESSCERTVNSFSFEERSANNAPTLSAYVRIDISELSLTEISFNVYVFAGGVPFRENSFAKDAPSSSIERELTSPDPLSSKYLAKSSRIKISVSESDF